MRLDATVRTGSPVLDQRERTAVEDAVEKAVIATLAGNPPPAPSWSPRARQAALAKPAAPAAPASSEPEIIPPPRPRRMRILDPERPLPPSQAPALRERWRANWADSPWGGR
jgi:hypothetical protein